MENNDKVQSLATKLDKIADSFGIAESTLVGLSNHIENISSNIPSTKNDDCVGVVIDDNVLDLVLQFNILKEDFDTVRSGLRDLISNSQTILGNIQTALILEGDLNADSINGFVNVGNLINNSMKMLMSNYNELLNIETKMKDRNKPKNDEIKPNSVPTIGGGNQIIIATNTADLIANGLISQATQQNQQGVN